MKKIASIALITGLIGLIGVFIFRNEIFSFGNKEQLMDATDFHSNTINQLDIDVDVVDFEIEKSSDDSIHVLLTGYMNKQQKKKLDYQVYHENHKLFIKLNQSNKWWFNFSILPFQNNRQLRLVLQLPDKHFEKLSLDSNVADISVNYGDFSTVNITSDVGDVEMENTKTSQADVETNVGDIHISDGVGRYDILSDVGEISLELMKWEDDVVIESDIGDVEVAIQQMPKAFRMDLTSDIGSVYTSGIRQDRGENNDGDVYLEVGTDGPLMDVRSDIGEIEVVNE
ncbi:DUF4097 family beta strand repeat-containing protein [Paraliobacillus sp. JSM ZJ581]|uniref:DUF4097 family beta strand repeat-containing protein n=1 Tax=Paraliobacillus sp. JSM ZJ581 TaxID=3342118 RepID=UPI0035A8DC40